MLNHLKKLTWYQFIFIFAVAALVLSSVFEFLTPKRIANQPLIESNYDGTQSSFKSVAYTGDLFSPPVTLPTAVVTTTTTSPDSFVDAFIKQYQLVSDPELPNLWKKDEYVLVRTSSPVQVTLTTSVQSPQKVINVQLAREQALEAVKLLYQDKSEPTLVDTATEYTTQGEGMHQEPSQPSSAAFVTFNFYYLLQNFPIYLEEASFPPAVVTVDADLTIRKIEVTPYVISYETAEEYPTHTLSQALDNISKSHASIISEDFYDHGTPQMESITAATFSSASIEYRADSTSKTVVPYYRFVGELTNDANQTFTAQVITPAIQTEFAQK